jgi:8-oxo-dGTP diphosphatase
MTRQRPQLDVHLVLRRGEEVLLGMRQNTGWRDGYWHLPAGHGEDGESATTALLREAVEEIGIEIDVSDVNFVHLVHHRTDTARLAIFYQVTRWRGEPINAEPDKCAGWQWFPLGALPEPMIDYAVQAITSYLKGEPYSELGWQD